jgi:hypothetical protein
VSNSTVRVVVVAVDIAPVAYGAFQSMHSEVEAAEATGFIGLFNATDGQLAAGIA